MVEFDKILAKNNNLKSLKDFAIYFLLTVPSLPLRSVLAWQRWQDHIGRSDDGELLQGFA